MKLTRGEFTLSSLNSDQQPERIHAYLTRSYWAEGISLPLVERCVAGSLCFGVFHNHPEAVQKVEMCASSPRLGQPLQIGLARVVTDRATFAYLCDVYILEEFRGRGLAAWLIGAVRSHPDLQGLRRFMLATRDAHGLYLKFGFKPAARPEALMEVVVSKPYCTTPPA